LNEKGAKGENKENGDDLKQISCRQQPESHTKKPQKKKMKKRGDEVSRPGEKESLGTCESSSRLKRQKKCKGGCGKEEGKQIKKKKHPKT